MISSSIALTKTDLTDINCFLWLRNSRSLSLIIKVKSFPKQLVMVIPRKVPGSEDSPLLKIGTINPVFQHLGKYEVFIIPLNRITRMSQNFVKTIDLIISLLMPSNPVDLPFFSFREALTISLLVID